VEQTALEIARQWFAAARQPVSFSGAGLSAESGIATFRTSRGSNSSSREIVSESAPDSSDPESEKNPSRARPLWETFDPVVMASQQGFQSDPETVIDWYAHRRKTVAAANPNAAHNALAANLDIQHITQNVDDLLERAGATDSRVVHLHGTLRSDKCNSGCGYEIEVDMAEPPGLMSCPLCADSCRPSVVWFGESLPQDSWQCAMQWISECDLLLVVGTSGVVYPAAGLVDLAREATARIVFVDPAVDAHDLQQANQREIYICGTAAEVLPQIVGRN